MADDYKIILFLCNWGPHAAYQALQDSASQIPAEVKMVRIPCTGRINKALLFKSFEMGADGVALVGCESGSCRYGTGTTTSQKNVEDSREILDLLGLRKDRLRLENFLPDESESLLKFLKEFADEIKAIGKSPVTPSPTRKPALEGHELIKQIKQIIAYHDVYACQDCGKCSSACPLTLSGKPSPHVPWQVQLSRGILTLLLYKKASGPALLADYVMTDVHPPSTLRNSFGIYAMY